MKVKATLVCMLILGLGFLAATPSFKDLLIPNNGMFRIWSSNSSGQADAEILRLTEADKSAVFGGDVSTAGSITTTGGDAMIFIDEGRARTLKHVAYLNRNDESTGILKIKLPVLSTGNMLNITIKGRTNSLGTVWEMQLGGYLALADSSWIRCSAMIWSTDIINNSGNWSTVRFGNDGESPCIFIGELNTTWNYPYIVVDTVQVRRHGNIELSADWTMTFITSEAGIIVDETVTPRTYIMGRVGIDRAPSSYALDVAGQIRSSSGVIANGESKINTTTDYGNYGLQLVNSSGTGSAIAYEWALHSAAQSPEGEPIKINIVNSETGEPITQEQIAWYAINPPTEVILCDYDRNPDYGRKTLEDFEDVIEVVSATETVIIQSATEQFLAHEEQINQRNAGDWGKRQYAQPIAELCPEAARVYDDEGNVIGYNPAKLSAMEIHESRKRLKQVRDYADNLEAELAQARTAIQNLNAELDNAKQFAQTKIQSLESKVSSLEKVSALEKK
jgi:hypothetical protein